MGVFGDILSSYVQSAIIISATSNSVLVQVQCQSLLSMMRSETSLEQALDH